MFIRRSPIWPDPRVKPPYGSVEIARGRASARGIKHFWILNAAGTLLNDLAHPQGAATILQPTIFSYRYSGNGTAIFSSVGGGGANGASIDVGELTQAFPMTWEVWMAVGANTNGYGTLLANNAVTRGFFTNTGVTARWYNGGNNDNTTAVGVDTWHNWVCTFDASGNGKWYLDGRPDGTFSGADTSFSYKYMLNTFNQSMQGFLLFQRLRTVELTAAEVFDTYVEPYASLRPIIRRRYFLPSAPAAANGDGVLHRRLARSRLLPLPLATPTTH